MINLRVISSLSSYISDSSVRFDKEPISFVLAGYVDYEYTANYLDKPLQNNNNDISFKFVYDSKNKTWLVDHFSTVNTGLQELPKSENEDDLVIKTF